VLEAMIGRELQLLSCSWFDIWEIWKCGSDAGK